MPRECPYCSLNAYDQFGIYVNPADQAWNLVEGGGGSILDPVDGPTGLTSVWTFGGHGATSAIAGSYSTSLAVTGGAPQHLTLVLDTATAQSADATKPSWGTLTNVQLTPYIGALRQPAVTLSWTASPFDPDGGTALTVDAGGLDLSLAVRDVGSSSRDTQLEGIWGAGAILPGRNAAGQAYTSYTLRFDYDLRTTDLRGTAGDQAQASNAHHGMPGIADSSLPLVALAAVALAFALRRLTGSRSRRPTAAG
jgi:hypothetical protein